MEGITYQFLSLPSIGNTRTRKNLLWYQKYKNQLLYSHSKQLNTLHSHKFHSQERLKKAKKKKKKKKKMAGRVEGEIKEPRFWIMKKQLSPGPIISREVDISRGVTKQLTLKANFMKIRSLVILSICISPRPLTAPWEKSSHLGSHRI